MVVNPAATKPRVVAFRRVDPTASSGSGPAVQNAAVVDPVAVSSFEVEIDNPGTEAVTSALAVKHVEPRPGELKQNVGSFPFTVAARSKTVVRFSDVSPLDLGCGPTRYELSGQGLASTRFGRITPTCTFNLTKTPSTQDPTAAIGLSDIDFGTLPKRCGDSWDIRVRLTAHKAFDGISVFIGAMGTASDVSMSVKRPKIDEAMTVLLRGPFRGHTNYSFGAVGGAMFAAPNIIPFKIDTARKCTIDRGQLE